MTDRRHPRSFALVLVALVALCGCGGGASTPSPAANPAAGLPEHVDREGVEGNVQRGGELYMSSGCAACHAVDGTGGVAPPLVGLPDSTVELEDGTTVVADTDYLRRAITDPEAQVVAGQTLVMPGNTLDAAEVEDVLAFVYAISDGK